MDREARAEAGGGRGSVHVRYRVDCLLKAISACHKCDLDSAQVRGGRPPASLFYLPAWSIDQAIDRSVVPSFCAPYMVAAARGGE